MKNTIFAAIILTASAGAAPRPLREHVDMHWTYDEENGWTCLAKTAVEGDDVFEELEEVYLPIDDTPEELNGQRYVQPAGEDFEFTGVPEGEPIWIASQIQVPDQCWPGFNNYQATGTFGAYQETDIRLSEDDRSLALPWIKVSLAGVTYQGSGSGSFALWQEDSSGNPTVWFSTTDNSHSDTYFFVAGSHNHLNWGFGSPGIYRIRLSASAYLGPGQTNPTGGSPDFTLTFAVGTFAHWQADNFSATELDDPLISGPEANSDQDGMKNVVEFAFGFDPRSGVVVPESPGLGLPKVSIVEEGGTFYQVLEYPARRAGAQIAPLLYKPEFSSDLNWDSNDIVTMAVGFPPEMDSLNGVWEKITARRPVGPSAPARGFGRVGVSSGD